MKYSRAGLLIAILLRIVLSTFFYHPDIKSQHFHASFLSLGVINIYEYIQKNHDKLPYTDTFNYPPLAYFTLGSWQKIASFIVGNGLKDWLWNWGDTAIRDQNIFSYLLILKLPYIIFDVLVGALGIQLLQTDKSKKRFLFLWLFNPLSLYITYMVGQFDILPVTLSMIAIVCFTKSKYFYAGLFLGLAAALKTYPLLFIPVFIATKPNKHIIPLVLGSMLGWLGPNVGFLFSSAYQDSVLKSSLASRIFALKIASVPIFVPYYIFILYSTYKKKAPLIKQIFAISTSVVVFTQFHAQWLLWSLPFSILIISENTKQAFEILIFYIFAMLWILMLADQYVLLGLFTPLNPYISTIPPIVSLFKTEATQYTLLLRNILIIFSVVIYLRSIRNEKTLA